MGALDGVSGFMMSIAMNYIAQTSNGLNILLQQSAIPISMVIRYVYIFIYECVCVCECVCV
jgi:hypothetical protein